MAYNWKSGFLAQAHSDYLMYRGLESVSVPRAHVLHYLQMFAEKAAKSFFTDGSRQPVADHRVLVRFLKLSKQSRMLRSRWKRGAEDYYRTVEGLMNSARWVESLAPSKLAQTPNPEYPWLQRSEEPPGSGNVVEEILIPAEYDFRPLSAKEAPKMLKLVEFMEWFFRVHNYPTPGEEYTFRSARNEELP